jgi:hypothetical protein
MFDVLNVENENMQMMQQGHWPSIYMHATQQQVPTSNLSVGKIDAKKTFSLINSKVILDISILAKIL